MFVHEQPGHEARACTEASPHSSKLVIEASTCIATTILAIAAMNRKVD